jgi:hypothetical protein
MELGMIIIFVTCVVIVILREILHDGKLIEDLDESWHAFFEG